MNIWIILAGLLAYFGVGFGIGFLLSRVWKAGCQKGFLARLLFPFDSRREELGTGEFDDFFYCFNFLFWPLMIVGNLSCHMVLALWRFFKRDNFIAFWKKELKEAREWRVLGQARDELDSCERRLRQINNQENFLKNQLKSIADIKGDSQELAMLDKARESFESELKEVLKEKIALAPRIGILVYQIDKREFSSFGEGVRVEIPEESETEYKKLLKDRKTLRTKLQSVEHAISEHEVQMELAGDTPYRPSARAR